MIRLTHLLERPLAPEEAARAVRLRLSYDERVKSRLATMSTSDEAVAVLLADHQRGNVLRDGAVLAGDEGALAIVEAAPQPVARVTTDSPVALLRAVYHLANRHVPAQIAIDHVVIERDPILEAMLHRLGARIKHIEAPFEPEGGAYHGDHAHGPSHREPVDEVSATIGEQLSIAAHRTRGPST
jgi:urease accessory protein